MITFSPRTRELALTIGHGYCQCHPGCTRMATEFHHRCPNTRINQRLYPIFLQSIFNCCPINHDCHMTKPLPRISSHDAGVYEVFLTEEGYGDKSTSEKERIF